MQKLRSIFVLAAGSKAVRCGLVFIIIVTLLVTLSACGASPSPSTIDYRRTGGIAGFDDHLIIQTTGAATLTRRGAQSTFTVDQATLKQLTTLLSQAGFSRLPAESLARGGADLFTYEIVYQGHRVRVQDTTVPSSLQPVIDLLNTIVQKTGPA